MPAIEPQYTEPKDNIRGKMRAYIVNSNIEEIIGQARAILRLKGLNPGESIKLMKYR